MVLSVVPVVSFKTYNIVSKAGRLTAKRIDTLVTDFRSEAIRPLRERVVAKVASDNVRNPNGYRFGSSRMQNERAVPPRATDFSPATGDKISVRDIPISMNSMILV